MTKQLTKPYPPADDDCCGGGACCPCVWDYYYEQMAQWQAQQKQITDENSVKSTEI